MIFLGNHYEKSVFLSNNQPLKLVVLSLMIEKAFSRFADSLFQIIKEAFEFTDYLHLLALQKLFCILRFLTIKDDGGN